LIRAYGDGDLGGKWRHLERARLRIVSGDRGFAGVALLVAEKIAGLPQTFA